MSSNLSLPLLKKWISVNDFSDRAYKSLRECMNALPTDARRMLSKWSATVRRACTSNLRQTLSKLAPHLF